MDMNEQTATLLKQLLDSKIPGDITCDGAKITHTCHTKVLRRLPIISEFQFSVDGDGLHMQGSISPDVHDMEMRKKHVSVVAHDIEDVCNNCAGKGSELCEKEPFKKFTFADGKISYPMQTAQPGPEPDSGHSLCAEFEAHVIGAFCHMFRLTTVAREQALVSQFLESLIDGMTQDDGQPDAPPDPAKQD